MDARGRLALILSLALAAAATVVALQCVEPPPEAATTATGDGAPTAQPEPPALPAVDAPSRDGSPAPAIPAAGVATPAAPVVEDEKELLRIKVVDASGAPVPNVEVAIYSSGILNAPNRHWGGTTGADGIARVPDTPALADRAGTPTRAAVCITTADALSLPVDLARPPAEPIVLAMPATGSVRVAVGDAGHPIGDEMKVSLHYVLERGSPIVRWTIREAPVVDGVATFEKVGLGLRFRAVAQFAAGSFGAESEFAGPAAAGQVVQHAIDRSHAHLFKGRLLGTDGEPLRDRTAQVTHVRIDNGGMVSMGTAFRTDADGRFRLWWSDETPAAQRRIGFVLTDDMQRESRAERDVDSPEIAKTRDLGDVRLVAEPLIVAGVVVDSTGKPAIALVECEGRDDDTHPWTRIGELSKNVRPPSTFAMLGKTSFRQLRLRARSGGIRGEPVECAAGATGVKLVLPATGAVAGAVRLGDAIEWRTVRLRLAVTDASGRVNRTEKLPQKDGTFEFEGLGAGKAILQVLDACSQPIVAIEDIAVTGGETTRDPRLAAIALEGVAVPVEVMVLDPAGRAVEDARLLAKSGAGESRTLRGSPAGRIRTLAGVKGIDATVFAEGYRCRAVHLPSDERVVLAPGIQVTIRAKDGADVTQGKSTVSVRLRSKDAARARPDELCETAAFGADRIATILCAEPGTFEVIPLAITRSENTEGTRTFQSVATITVADTAQLQTFEIELPADLWKKGG